MAISKAEGKRRKNFHYMADAMRKLEWDLHGTILGQMRIPPNGTGSRRTRARRSSDG